jgi:hypothetical protein
LNLSGKADEIRKFRNRQEFRRNHSPQFKNPTGSKKFSQASMRKSDGTFPPAHAKNWMIEPWQAIDKMLGPIVRI